MKVLIVFLIAIGISIINIPAYCQETEYDAEVAVPMTTEEIEAEINEMVDEEIAKGEIIEITKIDIPRDVLNRLRMAQSNINKWQKTMDTVVDKYQIALGDLNLAKLEIKRLWQVKDAEFKLFLMSNDIVDIKYDETVNWKRNGNTAVKK